MLVVAALMLMSSSSLLSCCCVAQDEISPQTFQQGIENGSYDLVIDVRDNDEWNDGRIATAVHVPSDSLDDINQLLTGGGMEESSSSSLFSCDDHCATIVVYCRSGARAKVAIQTLINDLGYTGTIYNGQGINQWLGAGYELVDDNSSPPPPPVCTKTDICACVNDPDFRKKTKDCVAYLKRKKGKKCHSGAKNGSGNQVYDFCPATCKKELCQCQDRKGKIPIKHNGEKLKVTCTEINERGWCQTMKKDYHQKFILRNICPVSCDTPCLN